MRSRPSPRRLGGGPLAATAAALAAFVAAASIHSERLHLLWDCLALGNGRALIPEEREPFETDFFGLVYRGHTEEMVDAMVRYFGAYEKPVLFLMRDLMPRDGVFVDIGANTGQHSLFMSRHAAVVHAVEPFPPVLEILDARMRDNRIVNVVVHRVGLSDRAGALPFQVPGAGNLGTGTFAAEVAGEAQLELPLVKGDELFREQRIERIDLIKLDIEGYEKLALDGMRETLAQSRPWVVFELNTRNDQAFHDEQTLRVAFPSRYRFLEIAAREVMTWNLGGDLLVCGQHEGHYELIPYDMRFDRSGLNLLAVPEEREGTLPTREANPS